ncbi:MAG: hypothetical protein N2444_04930 [Methylocystis sp.]|nr:hypothetical protein [Methylocystis sp.]
MKKFVCLALMGVFAIGFSVGARANETSYGWRTRVMSQVAVSGTIKLLTPGIGDADTTSCTAVYDNVVIASPTLVWAGDFSFVTLTNTTTQTWLVNKDVYLTCPHKYRASTTSPGVPVPPAFSFGENGVVSVKRNGVRTGIAFPLYTIAAGVNQIPAAASAANSCGWITDGAAALAWGATATGGSTNKYLVCSNGTAWTVVGK